MPLLAAQPHPPQTTANPTPSSPCQQPLSGRSHRQSTLQFTKAFVSSPALNHHIEPTRQACRDQNLHFRNRKVPELRPEPGPTQYRTRVSCFPAATRALKSGVGTSSPLPVFVNLVLLEHSQAPRFYA